MLFRYFAREILATSLLVLAALLALFGFFDLVRELDDVGRGNYRLTVMLGYVLLSLPSHAYVILPAAALIGTLFALARMSEQSELTVMRSSGLSMVQLAAHVAGAGVVVAVLTLAIGEFVTPFTEEAAKSLRLKATRSIVAREFRSGFWVKEDRSFVNIQDVTVDTELVDIKIYLFDAAYRLASISRAARGTYDEAASRWKLADVEVTRFEGDRAVLERKPIAIWDSVLTPDILSVLKIVPERMSVLNLAAYIDHLRDNRQKTTRFEIALWQKALYPAAAIVMMLLAIPFAIQSERTGGTGGKIVLGILLGLGFHFAGRLFSHVGLLNDWPAAFSAGMPALIFLAVAAAGIARAERR
jgi:lipopolysaccharide export system permease protein